MEQASGVILTISSPNTRQKGAYVLVTSFHRELPLPEIIYKGFSEVLTGYVLGKEQPERQAWEQWRGQDPFPVALQAPSSEPSWIKAHLKWKLQRSLGIISVLCRSDSDICIYLYPTCLQRIWGLRKRKRNGPERWLSGLQSGELVRGWSQDTHLAGGRWVSSGALKHDIVIMVNNTVLQTSKVLRD